MTNRRILKTWTMDINEVPTKCRLVEDDDNDCYIMESFDGGPSAMKEPHWQQFGPTMGHGYQATPYHTVAAILGEYDE